MTTPSWLEGAADAASILTALTAAWAYGSYRIGRYQKRRRLEDHLRDLPKRAPSDDYKPTVLDLAAALGMTETEVTDAAFRSKRIERHTTTPMFSAPAKLTFSYKDS